MTASSKSSAASSQSRGSYRLPAKPALIAAGALALGTGGYFANEWRVCSGLRDEYRTFAMETLANERLKSAAQSPAFDKMIEKETDAAVMRAGQALYDLQHRCGKKEAVKAQLEATELVLRAGPL